ncbi:hypothetical protein CCUS01_10271 [Colletotrichum cuscutae]|uniref:Uncharacterized protein n=1 Tax=Colletotrichum cuscutae TaxID=1209917 RepID=A0AAI9XMM2_9PEZI|nr:hypothetical protein CCUS01_10271 [Colletotrichum cuscutae]
MRPLRLRNIPLTIVHCRAAASQPLYLGHGPHGTKCFPYGVDHQSWIISTLWPPASTRVRTSNATSSFGRVTARVTARVCRP